MHGRGALAATDGSGAAAGFFRSKAVPLCASLPLVDSPAWAENEGQAVVFSLCSVMAFRVTAAGPAGGAAAESVAGAADDLAASVRRRFFSRGC